MRKLSLFVTALILAGCSPTPQEPLDTLGWPVEPTSAEQAAMVILEAISEQDMETLAEFVDGTVRFSPYTNVNTTTDVSLTPEELSSQMESDEVITWGSFDGSGEPIELTFADYYERFVADHDYREAPNVTWNEERVGHGSLIDNIADVYPDAEIVEYHFPGFDPQYEGMDWRALTLVLEEHNGKWVLVGVVHNEWTT